MPLFSRNNVNRARHLPGLPSISHQIDRNASTLISIISLWALLTCRILGTFHLSAEYLLLYRAEFTLRHNFRQECKSLCPANFSRTRAHLVHPEMSLLIGSLLEKVELPPKKSV